MPDNFGNNDLFDFYEGLFGLALWGKSVPSARGKETPSEPRQSEPKKFTNREQIADYTRKKYGKAMCAKCAKGAKEAKDGTEGKTEAAATHEE